jgi:hypothetical protein
MLTFRNKQDLLTLLNELKTELASLRVQKIAGGSASKVTKMCVGFLSCVWALEDFGNVELRTNEGFRRKDKVDYTTPADDLIDKSVSGRYANATRPLPATTADRTHARRWKGGKWNAHRHTGISAYTHTDHLATLSESRSPVSLPSSTKSRGKTFESSTRTPSVSRLNQCS